MNSNDGALKCAVLEEHTPMVSYPVRHRCDVHIANKERETAIMLAVRKKQMEMVRVLVQVGQVSTSVCAMR
ncbi:ankyrin repeat domain-containing protein [archaeon]|nr:MAG: ankyrin repeat domain-containing protein [archaeon]